MSNLKKFSSNRAITLIALIITIVVMLVLVAVGVSILVESDLIGTAEKTGDRFKSEQQKEQTLGQITIGNKTYASINDYINNNPIPKELKPGERATDGNGTYMGITIPEGFTVSKIPGEYGDTEEGINGGIVIYDIPSTVDTSSETFWTAETTVGTQTYPTVQVEYNQFVWVPVAEAYITAEEITNMINSTEEEYSSVTSNQTAINYLASQGRYPMAVQIPTTDENGQPDVMYRGILYNFVAGTNGIAITSYEDFSILASESYDCLDAGMHLTYNAEPRTVTYDYGGDESKVPSQPKPNAINLTQAKLQDEYDSMVESVLDNGGFYVARYELTEETVDSNKVFGTKRGKTVAYVTAPDGNMWYELYDKCQNLYNSNDLPVQSTMISGAQWDQIMIWMRGVTNTYTDSNDNQVNTYFVIDSTNKGNYETCSQQVSGYSDNYSVKKVFDLAGNFYDWTIEGDLWLRYVRGASCYAEGRSSASVRWAGALPLALGGGVSARSTLFVK